MSLPDGSQRRRAFLVLRIENSAALPLDALAELFAAMARDYRQSGGHQLSIEALRQGSLVALLHDLSDLADQANHLFEFAKNVIELAGAVIAGHVFIKSRRDANAKTVLALSNAAFESKDVVQLFYEGPNGEKLDLKITPKEAGIIQQRVVQTPAKTPFVTRRPPTDLDRLESFATAVALEAAPNRVGQEKTGEPESDLLLLLAELVKLVKRGPDGRRTLQELSRRLRSQGHYQVAQLIWSHDE